jgi:hypothetical protein
MRLEVFLERSSGRDLSIWRGEKAKGTACSSMMGWLGLVWIGPAWFPNGSDLTASRRLSSASSSCGPVSLTTLTCSASASPPIRSHTSTRPPSTIFWNRITPQISMPFTVEDVFGHVNFAYDFPSRITYCESPSVLQYVQ